MPSGQMQSVRGESFTNDGRQACVVWETSNSKLILVSLVRQDVRFASMPLVQQHGSPDLVVTVAEIKPDAHADRTFQIVGRHATSRPLWCQDANR